MRNFLLLVWALVFFSFSTSWAQDSLNMSLVGKYQFGVSDENGIALYNSYAYVTETYGWSNDNLHIVDVHDPSQPNEVNNFYLGDDFQARGIFISGNYALVGSDGPETRILDLTDPVSPKILSTYDDYCSDAYFKGNHAYLAARSSGLIILDISNPQSPVEVSYYEPSGESMGLDVRDTLVFLANNVTDLVVVSVRDFYNPRTIGTYNSDTPGYANDVTLYGDYALLADRMQGLKILDIRDLSNITEVATYVPDPKPSYLDIKKVVVYENYAYLYDATFGVRVLDLTDPTQPTQVACYRVGFGSDFAVEGNLVYLLGERTLSIVKNNLVTAISTREQTIDQYFLGANYPNPFNGTSWIEFGLPRKEKVTIVLFDLLGRQQKVLLDEERPAGRTKIKVSSDNLPSGVYFYQIRTPNFTQTRKLTIIR